MSDILARILQVKRAEVAQAKEHETLAALRARAEARRDLRDFTGALRAKIALGAPAVIAEVKRASPSRGLLREDFDPVDIGISYARAGAACVSVLTDRHFFQGAPAHLHEARKASGLPALRKDFIVDEYQVAEARAWGADCVLLIAAALETTQMRDLEAAAQALGPGRAGRGARCRRTGAGAAAFDAADRCQQPQPEDLRSVARHHARSACPASARSGW